MVSDQPARTRMCNAEDAPILAQLHAVNVSDRLGIHLLEVYYRSCLESKRSFCLCMELNGVMVGYVAAISDRIDLLKITLRRHWRAVLACTAEDPDLLLELLRHCWNWLRIPMSSARQTRLPRWEYRPVLVAKEYRGHGIAQILLAAAEEVLISKGAERVHLWVSRNNASALRAYDKSGFYPMGSDRLATISMVKNLRPAELCTDRCRPRTATPSYI